MKKTKKENEIKEDEENKKETVGRRHDLGGERG